MTDTAPSDAITSDARLRRMHFRAWHRGTKEADILLGSFVDTHMASFNAEQLGLMEALLEEQDVDILAWAIGAAPCPPRFEGELMRAIQRLDYLPPVR